MIETRTEYRGEYDRGDGVWRVATENYPGIERVEGDMYLFSTRKSRRNWSTRIVSRTITTNTTEWEPVQ